MGTIVNMINFSFKTALLSILLMELSACDSHNHALAPVIELNWRAGIHANQTQYIVVRGDTLYSIAFRYDEDYLSLAKFNHLSSPYSLKVGQVINLTSVRHSITTSSNLPNKPQQPVFKPIKTTVHSSYLSGHWLWPAKGQVVANFVPEQGKKGLDIAGHQGDKIYASAMGTVAYAGNGLSGYGNLIIIKHANQYLTAYGFNARNLVTEGQTVKAGQVIADMGMIERRYWGVHFEIRRSGKPVNPRFYLKAPY